MKWAHDGKSPRVCSLFLSGILSISAIFFSFSASSFASEKCSPIKKTRRVFSLASFLLGLTISYSVYVKENAKNKEKYLRYYLEDMFYSTTFVPAIKTKRTDCKALKKASSLKDLHNQRK